MVVADIRSTLANVGGPAGLLPRTIPDLPRGRHATKVAYRMGWAAAVAKLERRRPARQRSTFSGRDYSDGQPCERVGALCWRWDHAHKRARGGAARATLGYAPATLRGREVPQAALAV